MAQTAKHKFTPGPWKTKIAQVIGHASLTVIAEAELHKKEHDFVCLVSPMSAITKQDEANAKLISQAPNLLKALDEARTALIMTSLIDKSSVSKNALRIVEQAIKDAT